MNKNGFKEYFIHTELDYNLDDGWFKKVDLASENLWDAGQIIHVIEKQAYDELKIKLETTVEFFVDNQTLVGKIANDKWHAGYETGQMELQFEINKLERQLEIAIKALEFYANKLNYTVTDEGRNYSVSCQCYELDEETYDDMTLGTRALQALKQIQGYNET